MKHFTILFGLLQIVGLSPINVALRNAKTNHFVDTIVNIVPTTLTTIIALCISYFLLLYPHFESYGPIHGIINTASLISLSLITITGNVSSFFKKSLHRNINKKILQIEQRMFTDVEIKPLHPISAYKVKIFVIYFLFVLSQALVFYEASIASSAGMLSSFFTSLLRFIFPTAVSHVILYCDILANFIRRLNLKINCASTLFQTSNKVEFLRKMKMMHMDIWTVLMQLNRYFGWNSLFLVINSFVYITYQLYWIFVTLHKQWDKLGVIGNDNDFEILVCYYGRTLLHTTSFSESSLTFFLFHHSLSETFIHLIFITHNKNLSLTQSLLSRT